ncbi:uncharacterized protein LOC125664471 [Ostrea edulis]|uniref:uncharacterized protein LOC125664471 n=1 Tax=Ostrea edulis TaxID=37623 RepID=UPI0024AECA4B|nr:uncharacterized protein LOC125664471 [Ostrea edulis]
MDARVLVQIWYIMAEILRQGEGSSKDECNKFNSTCCYNQFFDTDTDSCVECALGSFGWNCDEQCINGFYGFLCKRECKCDAHLCDSARGCTTSDHEYNTNETTSFNNTTVEAISHLTMPPNDSTVEVISYSTMSPNDSTVKSISKEAGPTEVPDKNVQTKFRFNPTRIIHPREDFPNIHSYHHDSNQWMSVSFLLIGSLATIFIFGILVYLRTTKRCNYRSYHPRLGDNVIQQDVDDEDPADTTLAAEEQSDDYAEIRYSQFNVCSGTFPQFHNSSCASGEIGACGIGLVTKQNVYDRYDNDCEYSRLQLRKKQSRIINQDGTQKQGFINQDEEVYVSLKPSDITDSPFMKANTLPRNSRINIGENKQNTEFSHDIIRSTSESKLFEFEKDSPKPVTRMEGSMAREIQRNDTKIDVEDRPYSLVKLLDISE